MGAFDDIDNWGETDPEKIERANAIDKMKTALDKISFKNKIISGLGNEIKLAPSEFKVIKKPWYVKLKLFIKNIFNKF